MGGPDPALPGGGRVCIRPAGRMLSRIARRAILLSPEGGLADLVHLEHERSMNEPVSDDVEATPDELLLELMDLVVLAFPEPLYQMSIAWKASDDGSRPALTELDGKARPGTAKRPALGHDDNAVLDAINALLVEFGDATQRQGGVRVLEGKITMQDGDDGDRFVQLHDAQGVAMTRRFDSSELRWLFWTAPLFARLSATAHKEALASSNVEAALRSHGRFDIDMKQGRIVFSGAGAPSPWTFELLGSWSDESKRFVWGWANDHAPPLVKARVEKLRSISTGDGLRALSEASFGCPEPAAERLARHAAACMDAFGMYRAPFSSTQGKGFMYLALFTL